MAWDTPPDLTTIVVTPVTRLTVTRESLTYRGADGVQRQLALAECRANWVDYLNRSLEFPGTDRTIAASRGVGWRDSTHRPPYIDIFSQPRTRFIFRTPATFREWLWWQTRYPSYSPHAAFNALHEQIMAAGWQLFDLSYRTYAVGVFSLRQQGTFPSLCLIFRALREK